MNLTERDAVNGAAGAPDKRTPDQHAPDQRTDVLGRVLIVVYLILAIAATMRALYQLISKFDEAPLAYSLSAFAGLVYILVTVALIKRRGVWRTIAWIALAFEFLGVIVVGTLSFILPELFAHPSVWSHFGEGYLFIPLVIPVLGMLWLRKEQASHSSDAAPANATLADAVGGRQ